MLRIQHGQAMVEYIVICVMLVAVFFIPFGGVPLYTLVVDAIRLMHKGYMYGISSYATPF